MSRLRTLHEKPLISSYFPVGQVSRTYRPDFPVKGMTLKVVLSSALGISGICPEHLSIPRGAHQRKHDRHNRVDARKSHMSGTARNGAAYCRCRSGFPGDGSLSSPWRRQSSSLRWCGERR
jgi:hypothetical protein